MLQEDSISILLLKSLIEGQISLIHASQSIQDDKFEKSKDKIQKIFGLFELNHFSIEWNVAKL
jgi:hypothetical protein